MTKVTILGEEPQKKELKKIEFIYKLNDELECDEANRLPGSWGTIELISVTKNYKYDLMFAYDDDRNMGCLYLGRFNDGIV